MLPEAPCHAACLLLTRPTSYVAALSLLQASTTPPPNPEIVVQPFDAGELL